MNQTAQKIQQLELTRDCRNLFLILFALTLTDFFLTYNLIQVHGLEVEANEFMRKLFAAHPSGYAALAFKIVSVAALYFVFYNYPDKSFKKLVLVLAVLLYTIIIFYSLILTYPEWFFHEFGQIKQALYH